MHFSIHFIHIVLLNFTNFFLIEFRHSFFIFNLYIFVIICNLCIFFIIFNLYIFFIWNLHILSYLVFKFFFFIGIYNFIIGIFTYFNIKRNKNLILKEFFEQFPLVNLFDFDILFSLECDISLVCGTWRELFGNLNETCCLAVV